MIVNNNVNKKNKTELGQKDPVVPRKETERRDKKHKRKRKKGGIGHGERKNCMEYEKSDMP